MNAASVARLRSWLCVLGIAVIASTASAEPTTDAAEPPTDTAEPESEPEYRLRPLAVAASVVPGALWHGAGHHVLGAASTGRKLGKIELVGLSMAAVGGAYLGLTGASRYLATPSITLVVAGLGLFSQSWLADIYGTTGASNLGGRAPANRPDVTASLGYSYVDDPQFAYSQFASARGEVGLGSYRVRPMTDIAVDADNQRGRVEVDRSILEDCTGGDGSRLHVQGAATHHRYGDERFSTSSAELAVSGRLDLARLGPTLRGSFGDLRVGLGGELIDYRDAGFDLGTLLLVRFGYGIYLGRGRGEVSLFYDHRRDAIAGGISPGPGPGSGFLGFMGVHGVYWLTSRWGLAGEFEQGSARIGRLWLARRWGGVE